jgi:hypothetical protein
VSVTDATDDYTLEGWLSRWRGAVGPGGFPNNSSSVAYEASRTVKSGAGTLFGFSGYSTAAQFVQVFDAQTLPADGAIPVTFLAVTANGNFSDDWGSVGRAFSRGIFLCCSSTGPTKTIGTATCFFDAQYV